MEMILAGWAHSVGMHSCYSGMGKMILKMNDIEPPTLQNEHTEPLGGVAQ